LENLSAWLANVDTLCGSVLREPTSGLHKMNLALALRRSKHVMTAAGRGRKVDQLIAHLAEVADMVRRQIWGSQSTFGDQYLKVLRSMIEGLRREVVALIAEIEGTQSDPSTSLLTDRVLASRGPVEKIVSPPAAASRCSPDAGESSSSIHRSFWTDFIRSLGKVVRKGQSR